ncbi:hypothetical protein D869_gp124 [Caulobacter phage CcrRogue]|uniref:Uncharacterized protein n=1 Tax=Caulobacter phage CcrRogue TaxID=2927986 RepID=K4JR74_9CAUD|nr:hypothetical protein D869_gp124 [Caulobacter phage CcrRogue]AFU86790.1 hypothetical protein CcrRogue_gp308 [Caulobacter phage CcrRogue]
MLSRSARHAQMTGKTDTPDLIARGYWHKGQWVRNTMASRLKAYIDRVPDVRFFEDEKGYYPGIMLDLGGDRWSITPITGRFKRDGEEIPAPPFSDVSARQFSLALMRKLEKEGALVAAVLDVRYDGKTTVARFDPVT